MTLHECDGHAHDHSHGDELGLSLYPQINFPEVFCLNEEVANAGKGVLKTHELRKTEYPSLTSPEDDAELLLHVPFTEAVTIQSISIRSIGGSLESSPPRTVKLFVDRENIDFDAARELPPQATLDLLPPDHFVEGSLDYPLRPAGRFQNISSVTLFFVDNYTQDEESCTEVTFVGFKGKGTRVKRLAVDTVYESSANLADHDVKSREYKASENL